MNTTAATTTTTTNMNCCVTYTLVEAFNFLANVVSMSYS